MRWWPSAHLHLLLQRDCSRRITMTALRVLLICCIVFMPIVKAGEEPSEPCAKDWVLHGTRYFKLFTTAADWAVAERACQSNGGHLASIHSAEEHRFLAGLVKKVGNISVWIGGSDAVKVGTWFWSDGSKWDFAEWASGEPNNGGQKQHCAQLWAAANMNFDDFYCESPLAYVCAKTA
ncbi:galactose-specific lectin nattectin-like isoform X1 [Denticeps clupeoides]|uniref:galactose-specific lectin nattectin-like isoform X1 n=1 Tax=Denticeps clupeoides TaxID=299321 RepID=UPI0010A5840B|nr:galactose-specific lectin nattectin-like isoform X1 [Denticeps clupeoides]